jgi:hypothetical protein
VGATVAVAFLAGPIPALDPIENPFGLEGTRNFLGPLATVSGALERGILGLIAVASLFLRLRRARREERQQIKWFATFFFAAASIKLFSTNLGILDWVSRLTADSLKVSFLSESQFWSESKIYLTVVWTMITIGSGIILTGIEPVVLLIIASSGGGFVMALYSTMLIVLNRRALPDEIRLKGWRLPIIVITAVFFIALSLFLLYQIITAPGSLA